MVEITLIVIIRWVDYMTVQAEWQLPLPPDNYTSADKPDKQICFLFLIIIYVCLFIPYFIIGLPYRRLIKCYIFITIYIIKNICFGINKIHSKLKYNLLYNYKISLRQIYKLINKQLANGPLYTEY